MRTFTTSARLMPSTKPESLPASTRLPLPADCDRVASHLRDLHRFVRAMGAREDLADDLTQEALVIAVRRQKLQLEPRALAAFLRRSARLVWLQRHRGDHRRRKREAQVTACVEQLWQRSDDDTRHARIVALRACVALLQGRAANAVALAYRDDFSREQIANELGMSPNGVRTLLARTRRWLESCIARKQR